MRIGLDTLLMIISATAAFLALNVPPTSTVDSVAVLPGINVSYSEIPDGYVGRIPGPASGQPTLRPRLANELVAKKITIRRGWPLSIQNDRGFLYELDDGQAWFALPVSQPQTVLARLSVVGIIANVSVVLVPATALYVALRVGRRRLHCSNVT